MKTKITPEWQVKTQQLLFNIHYSFFISGNLTYEFKMSSVNNLDFINDNNHNIRIYVLKYQQRI